MLTAARSQPSSYRSNGFHQESSVGGTSLNTPNGDQPSIISLCMQDTGLQNNGCPKIAHIVQYCHHFYKCEQSYTKHLLQNGLGCTRFCAQTHINVLPTRKPTSTINFGDSRRLRPAVQSHALCAILPSEPLRISTSTRMAQVAIKRLARARANTASRDERACRAHEAICSDNSGKPATSAAAATWIANQRSNFIATNATA